MTRLGRTDLSTINLHRRLAAVFVKFLVAGCAQVATSQGQGPYAPYSPLTPTGNIHATEAVMAAEVAAAGCGGQGLPTLGRAQGEDLDLMRSG